MTDNRRGMNIYLKRIFVLQFLLEHLCVDCGEKDPVVLDFDHLSELGKKIYSISEMINSSSCLESLKLEINKCAVRCSNCHRRKTAKDFGSYRLMKLEELQEKLDSMKICAKRIADNNIKRGQESCKESSILRRKLSIEQANDIRSKYIRNIYGMKRLAKEYDVSANTIRDIINGKHYRE
jgi:5-methylcytosine-specific restriction endonuclease McrA